MCTPKYWHVLNAGKLRAVLDKLHHTSGGWSDTELKLLAVSPISDPLRSRVVTIVTPVAKAPSA